MTQSCVDQYLDSILLKTIYSSAHQESLASLGLSDPQVFDMAPAFYLCHHLYISTIVIIKVETSLQAGPVDRRGSTGGLKVARFPIPNLLIPLMLVGEPE